MASSALSQAFLLLALSMVLIPFSLAQAPMMAPSGSVSMPPMPRSGGRSSSHPTMSPMPMMTPPPMPMMTPLPMPMAPPPMMPTTPSISPMASPTSPMGPSPIPATIPDMASPPMPMEGPSPGTMPPASPASGAFNVRNDVVAFSCVVGVVAAHLLFV